MGNQSRCCRHPKGEVSVDYLTIFFFMAGFTLLRLIWEDLKDRQVSVTWSYYMMGAVGTLFMLIGGVWLWLALTLIVIFGLSYVKAWVDKRAKSGKTYGLGEGDISILSWLLPGLGILSWVLLVLFIFFYALGIIIYFFLKKEKELEGTIPMFLALLVVWGIHQLFLLGVGAI